MPQITLCPPGACPPESTTPTLSGLVAAGSADGTSDAEGWPNRLGKSLAISSAPDRLKNPTNLMSSNPSQTGPQAGPERSRRASDDAPRCNGRGSQTYRGCPRRSWRARRRRRSRSGGRRGGAARAGGGSSAPRCTRRPAARATARSLPPPRRRWTSPPPPPCVPDRRAECVSLVWFGLRGCGGICRGRS